MNRPGRRLISILLCCTVLLSLILPVSAEETSAAQMADSWSEEEGIFSLIPESRLFYTSMQQPDDALTQTMKLISAEFAAAGRPTKEPMPLCWGEMSSIAPGDIVIAFSDKLAPDAYELRITEETVSLTAADTDGLLYGARMLLKLLLAGKSNTLSCGVITDTPDTEQRALMIDCARKYWSVPWLKNLISQMSWMGYNQLELHLGEDQGLRTDIWSGEPDRNGNDFSWLIGYDSGWNEDYPDLNAEKFYTADDMRDLAEYAQEYHIELIPDLDLPPHCDVMTKRYADFVAEHPDFSFTCQGVTYAADGMVTDGGTMRPYDEEAYPNVSFETISVESTDSTLDVANPVARAFGLAVLQAYAEFFYGLGCTKFNFCFDELSVSSGDGWITYAEDYVEGGENAYDTAADFANEVAALLKEIGYTSIRAFNDVLYNTRRNIDLDPDIELCVWSLDDSDDTEEYLADGRTLYNCIQNYCYYALRYTDRSNGGDARDPENTWWAFNHSTEELIYEEWNPSRLYNADEDGEDVTDGLGGGFFLIWGDFGGWRTEEQVWNGEDETDGQYNLIDRMWSNSAKMWNWSMNNTMEYEQFARLRSSFRTFPGFTECTKEPVLPNPPAMQCVPSADHAQIHDLLASEDALPIDRAAFTDESVAAYEEAYQRAAELDADYFSTAGDLVDAVSALQDAVMNLEYLQEPLVIAVEANGRRITALYPERIFGHFFLLPLTELDGYAIDRVEGNAVLADGVLIGMTHNASVTICVTPAS